MQLYYTHICIIYVMHSLLKKSLITWNILLGYYCMQTLYYYFISYLLWPGIIQCYWLTSTTENLPTYELYRMVGYKDDVLLLTSCHINDLELFLKYSLNNSSDDTVELYGMTWLIWVSELATGIWCDLYVSELATGVLRNLYECLS